MVGCQVLSRPLAAEGGGRRPAFTGPATQPYSATEVGGWQQLSRVSQNRAAVQPATVKKLPALLRRRPSSRLRLVDGLDAVENLAEIALRDLNVIVVLQIEPKQRRRAERLGEPKRCIGGNAGLFVGDPLDSRSRQAAGLGKCACRHFERNQELLPQNLTGMHGLEFFGHCRALF